MKQTIKELKSFAITMSWAFPAVFGTLLPWLFSYSWQLWPLTISSMLMVMYFIRPAWLSYPFRFWMFFGGIIGWINTRIILGLSFYLLIAPLGIFMRAIGKLQYRTKMKTNATTNYVLHEAKSDKKNLEYPF